MLKKTTTQSSIIFNSIQYPGVLKCMEYNLDQERKGICSKWREFQVKKIFSL